MAQLMVLMFTDIVDSVDMKRDLGGLTYQRSSTRHDEIFGEIVKATSSAEIIKDTGDGFLARFDTPSDAVSSALKFQHALNLEPWESRPVRVRIGIHVGEVSELGVDALGAPKIVGLAADMAARLMSLALPGQILLTRAPFDDARQYLTDHPLGKQTQATVRWMAHGEYLFKGNDETLDVYEVGIEGISPLAPPGDGEKARRAVSAVEEALLGWRPASGLEIPSRSGWILEKKLGVGGFGEVWLATHRQTFDKRVFKFCFDGERLHSFKRELTLFRLIRESLGERRDIAKLYEIQLDQPPYFLESEYTESGDLSQWAEKQGGVGEVALETRLSLVARTAEAVTAAHSIGILHKDIKPSNILIYEAEDGTPRPRLADFGIGMITDRSRLEDKDITLDGFTDTDLEGETSYGGTRLYAPPENLVGKAFTIQGDIYALGVLLYQMAVGNLDAPLGAGWERDIASAELREDIARCVDRDPERRLRSANDLAKRLDSLEGRSVKRRQQTRRTRLLRIAIVTSGLLTAVATALTLHIGRISQERDRANQEAETSRKVSEFLIELFKVSDPSEARGSTITAREILDEGVASIDELEDQPLVKANLTATMGNVYRSVGLYTQARELLENAVDLREELLGGKDPELAASLDDLGLLFLTIGDYNEGAPLLERALEIREQALGPDHPAVAESLTHFASVQMARGKVEEAVQLNERALAIREATFGSDHPETADSLRRIAILHAVDGYDGKARPLFERILAIYENNYPPNHPKMAIALNDLALILNRLEEYDEALRYFERVLTIQENAYGPDHIMYAKCLNNLVLVLKDIGDLERARELAEQSLAIREENLGPNAHKVAQSLGNLAEVLTELGEDDLARAHYERAMGIRESVLGPDHKELAMDLEGLARLATRRGDYSQAETMFRRALEIREQKQGADHPELTKNLEGYVLLLRKLGRNAEADKLSIRAYRIREAHKLKQVQL